MTSALSPLVAGNWKMNGMVAQSSGLVNSLLDKVRAEGAPPCEILVCPPAHLITLVSKAIQNTAISLGSQDCHDQPSGAHTGEISAEMLSDVGCTYVIVGHSERRSNHGETDSMVCRKVIAAHRAALISVVCVGETEAERDSGMALQTVKRQLTDSLPEETGSLNTVIAYEPVWAIGTGKTPTYQEISDVHGEIHNHLVEHFGPEAGGLRLLYGGSVNARNASEIMAIDNVDGGLVGGASLKAETFWPIIQAFGKT